MSWSVRRSSSLLGILVVLVLALLGAGTTTVTTASADPVDGGTTTSVDAAAAGSGNLAPSADPVVGFADLHNHQFGNLGFGGLLLFGEPFHEEGLAHAVPWSDFTPTEEGEVVGPDGDPVWRIACGGHVLWPTYGTCPATCPPGTGPGTGEWCWGVAVHGHGGVDDLLKFFLNQGGLGHLVGGYPQFDGYPDWNMATGQQVYVEWLRRSWLGGQRFMSMLAVNNESLCYAVNRRAAFGCDDMSAVDRQIQGAKNLENYVDRQDDGVVNGSGWYRIAYSSAEAREIMAAGKLAVVLGIEVPSLFDCKPHAGCTEAHVQKRLDHYHDLGVRHVLPVHNADNAFAGTALYNEIFAANNAIITGDWWDIENCPPDSGMDFRAGMTDDWFFRFVVDYIGAENAPPVPEGPSCNARGLTPLGASLVEMLVEKKMIIDVDHMSTKSLNSTLAILEAHNYPAVVMSHSGFHGATLPGVGAIHEGNKSDEQLERIRALGGTVSTILHQGGLDTTRTYVRPDGTVPLPYTCGGSSQAWAQAYLYAVEKMEGRAVALGSDFNGLAGMPAPRFGDEACKGDHADDYAPTDRVEYPFLAHGTNVALDRQRVGEMVFDYNVDGLGNAGQLPDFIEDLRRQGLTDADLAPLFGSAEQVVRSWELAEDSTPPEVACSAPDGAWHADNVTVACTAADAVAGLADPADASFALTTAVAAGQEDAAASTGTREVCDVRGNCTTVGPVTGHKVDRRAPSIDLVSPAARTYTVGESRTTSYTCEDGGSGVAECVGTLPDGAALPTGHVGTFTFEVAASDHVGNASQASADYTVSYAVCPLFDTAKAKPAGSVVPVAIMLCDADGANVSSEQVQVSTVALVRVSDQVTAPVESVGSSSPDSGFRWSNGLGAGGGYKYNLSTKGMASGTWDLRITATGDPTVHVVRFQLK